MFNFDDRYIVLVILSPGIFFLGLIQLLLSLLNFSFITLLDDSVMLQFGFSFVLSLISGSILWFIFDKGWLLDKYRLKKNIQDIENGSFLKPLGISLSEINKKFKNDFNKDFISEDLRDESYLRSNFNDIFYGLDRKIGLKSPSAYRLIRQFIEQIIVAIRITIIPYIVSTLFIWTQKGCSIEPIKITFVLVLLIILNFLLKEVLISYDRKFYYALLDVYTAKHYWNMFDEN